MSGPVKYDDNQNALVIEASVIRSNFVDRGYMFNYLGGDSDTYALKNHNAKDVLPLRIFDGQLVPYVKKIKVMETVCYKDQKNCGKFISYKMQSISGSIHVSFAESSVSGAITAQDVKEVYKGFIRYPFISHKPTVAAKIRAEMDGFAKAFKDAYLNNEDLVFPMSKKTYELISTNSSVPGKALARFDEDAVLDASSSSLHSVRFNIAKLTYILDKDADMCLKTILGDNFLKIPNKVSSAAINYLMNQAVLGVNSVNNLNHSNGVDIALSSNLVDLLSNKLSLNYANVTNDNPIEVSFQFQEDIPESRSLNNQLLNYIINNLPEGQDIEMNTLLGCFEFIKTHYY